MALKSYREGMSAFYKTEKAAFEGLKYDDTHPIVRYLGCYSHRDVRCGDDGNTFNILLEFGQMDLDEYCADTVNIPPVRSLEIIRFWESLFKVAYAIRRVHSVSISDGNKKHNYDGYAHIHRSFSVLTVVGYTPISSRIISLVCMENSNSPTLALLASQRLQQAKHRHII